jgi:hypothetical protein
MSADYLKYIRKNEETPDASAARADHWQVK